MDVNKLRELVQEESKWRKCGYSASLEYRNATNPAAILELLGRIEAAERDAKRYQVLRDSKYQLDEDDICVSDSFFTQYLGEELDAAVDALRVRYDAEMSSEDGK